VHQPHRTHRKCIAFVATTLVVVLLAATAYAFFTGASATTGSAWVGSLDAPSHVVASPDMPGSVRVTWDAVTVNGATVDGYRVLRDGAVACSTTVPQPATACTDTPAAGGTYRYTVVAVFRSWTATSAPSAPVTVTTDAAAPTASIAFPGAGAYNATAWSSAAACGDAICGTAHDGGSGVVRVQVGVREGTGDWFDGRGFSSATEQLHAATGTTAWSLPFPTERFAGDGSYTVRVVATDNAGNTGTTSTTFVYDSTAPTGTLSVPPFVRDGAVLDGSFSDAAGSGVASVTYRYCTGASCTPGTLVGTATGTTAVTWSTMPADGSYRVQATVLDDAGNAGVTPIAATTVDNTAPFHALSLTALTGGAALNGSTVYFKSNASGSFRLVDTVSDPTAGAASVTYAAVNATKWEHGAETVTGASPFTSAPYTWDSGAATPTAHTVTAHDNAGNATPTSLSFADDTRAPVGSFVIGPDDATTSGYVHQGGTYYVWANLTDAGSGVASVFANVGAISTGRTSVALVPGSYDGPNGTTWNYRSAAITANTSLSTSSEKLYFLTATDRVGNSTGPRQNKARVDDTAPTIAMTAPAARSYNAATWAAACATDGACGTAADPSSDFPSQVGNVRVTITRASDGRSWDGTAWQPAAVSLTATGTTTWAQALAAANLDDATSYTVRAYATDNAGNQSSTVTATFTYDTTPPVLQSLTMHDGDADGRIDLLRASFDEPVAAGSATSPWQLENAPSGATVAYVSTSGANAYVTLEEGSAANTAVGAFTVALAANGSGLTDAAGNPASFAATAPADLAGPVAVSFRSFDNDDTPGNGKLQPGDYVEVQFSEALAPTWTAPAVGTVTLTGGKGSDRIDLSGNVSRGEFSTGRNDYIAGNGTAVTFASTITLPAATTLRVTLGACAGSCSALTTPSPGSTSSSSFLPSSTLRDAAGNLADGTVTADDRFF
jgi:hypothetical protein